MFILSPLIRIGCQACVNTLGIWIPVQQSSASEGFHVLVCVYVFSGKPLCDNHNSQLNITVCEIQEQLQIMHYECQVINDFNTTLRFGKRFRHWSWEEWRIFQHYESTTVEPRFVVLSESQVSSLVQLNTLTGPLSPNTNHLHRWSQTGRNDQPMVFQAVAAHSSSRRQAKYSGIYWECKQSILNQYSTIL